MNWHAFLFTIKIVSIMAAFCAAIWAIAWLTEWVSTKAGHKVAVVVALSLLTLTAATIVGLVT